MPLVLVLLSTDLGLSSLWCCPRRSHFPVAMTSAVCIGLFLFFLVFFLLLTLLMARSPQVRDCLASRKAIDFYLGTY